MQLWISVLVCVCVCVCVCVKLSLITQTCREVGGVKEVMVCETVFVINCSPPPLFFFLNSLCVCVRACVRALDICSFPAWKLGRGLNVFCVVHSLVICQGLGTFYLEVTIFRRRMRIDYSTSFAFRFPRGKQGTLSIRQFDR